MPQYDERFQRLIRQHQEADDNVGAAMKLLRTASRQYMGLQEACLEDGDGDMATVHAAYAAVTEVAMYGLREFNDDWTIDDDPKDED